MRLADKDRISLLVQVHLQFCMVVTSIAKRLAPGVMLPANETVFERIDVDVRLSNVQPFAEILRDAEARVAATLWDRTLTQADMVLISEATEAVSAELEKSMKGLETETHFPMPLWRRKEYTCENPPSSHGGKRQPGAGVAK